MGSQKNHLNETYFLSTQNLWKGWSNSKRFSLSQVHLNENEEFSGPARRPRWKRSGSVIECLTRDLLVLSLTGVTALWSLSKTHLSYSLVLVQPKKTRPCLTERLLMGHKESNQTNKKQGQGHNGCSKVTCAAFVSTLYFLNPWSDSENNFIFIHYI